ncbi:hypothetical protein IWQ57_004578 [Coemansia nantahalensis]|uniref:Uncharacterized protein n=1 Tax=Coemansia nantahalensis TaxID=2789366 RepID=A0ACC1JRK5_9FUNG|nr:hypothetical protein IWQ57_004578 [Coemansia nantahalensis]
MQCCLLARAAVLAVLVLALVSAEEPAAQEHLDKANGLFQRGEYSSALQSYDAALAKDPQNYLTYFKRATTLLSINRHASAVRDFSRAIELKADFDQAYYQRARVYVKEGSYSRAEDDLDRISGQHAKLAGDARDLRAKVAQAQDAERRLARVLDKRQGEWHSECIEAATALVRISPLSASALKARGSCRVAAGDLAGASADLGRLVRIHPGDLETHNMLADLHFLALDERERGLEHVRACLKSDPDNKQCKATHGRLRGLGRKLDKLAEDRAKSKWNTCNRAVAPLGGKGGLLASVDSMYAEFAAGAGAPATAPSRLATHLAGIACEGYSHTKRWDSVLAHCGRVLDADPDDADALGFLFDAQLESDQLDQAQVTLGRIEKGADGRQRAQERRMQLERKKRVAARKDYYKILDVARDAAPAEIKRAYRKMAHQWHPDRYRGDLPKEQVESRMAEINQAYELLMDEEARTRYDQGHDPNDPAGGAADFGGFGNPFAFQQGEGRPVFFQQGGGGGKQFSFQFGGFPF